MKKCVDKKTLHAFIYVQDGSQNIRTPSMCVFFSVIAFSFTHSFDIDKGGKRLWIWKKGDKRDKSIYTRASYVVRCSTCLSLRKMKCAFRFCLSCFAFAVCDFLRHFVFFWLYISSIQCILFCIKVLYSLVWCTFQMNIMTEYHQKKT